MRMRLVSLEKRPKTISCKVRARDMEKGLPGPDDSDGDMIVNCMASRTRRNDCLLCLSH